MRALQQGQGLQDLRHAPAGFLLGADFSELWRPSKSKLVLYGQGNDVVVHVDPGAPGRNKFEVRKINDQNVWIPDVSAFSYLDFVLVSDFGFRASYFHSAGGTRSTRPIYESAFVNR